MSYASQVSEAITLIQKDEIRRCRERLAAGVFVVKSLICVVSGAFVLSIVATIGFAFYGNWIFVVWLIIATFGLKTVIEGIRSYRKLKMLHQETLEIESRI